MLRGATSHFSSLSKQLRRDSSVFPRVVSLVAPQLLFDRQVEGVWLVASTCAQQYVHPTSGSLRVFKQFAKLEVDTVKTALSHPAQPPVTPAVRRLVDK